MDGLECIEILLSSLERTSRIDAEFYKKENLAISEFLKRKATQSLTKSFIVSDGNHMSISDYFCNVGIPYYRGQDIYKFFIEEASPVCIDYNTFNHPHMKRSHLKRGDVLMSIVGAIVGNTAIVTSDTDATCSCKLAIIRSKGEDINPETLLCFIKTKYGQNQIQRFKRGAAQTGILLEDFDQIFIPYFTKLFQKRISEVIQYAKTTMMKATEEHNNARKYLLNSLKFDSLKLSSDGIAVKKLSESFAFSGRLDAEYYQCKYDDLFYILSKVSTKSLGSLVTITKSIEPGSECYGEIGVPFIRVSDISITGINNPSIKIPENTVPFIETLFPKKDTILFSKDGSVGIAYQVEEDLRAVTSGALLHFKVKNTKEILPEYLTLVLNSDIVQLQAERDASGAIIQHWKPDDIKKVTVPILSYEIQKEISDSVKSSFTKRRKAEKLIQVAINTVELAIENGEDAALKWLETQVD